MLNVRVVYRKPDGKGFPRWGISSEELLDGQTCDFLDPRGGGMSQPQRAAGHPLPFTTEKHTGSGIEPGVSDCEATAFPRRHCTPPLMYNQCCEVWWPAHSEFSKHNLGSNKC